MQVVIDIDRSVYNRFVAGFANDDDAGLIENLFKQGKILPKGHGRLIDADEIQFENTEFAIYSDYSIAFDAIDYAPTILEADTESEDKI